MPGRRHFEIFGRSFERSRTLAAFLFAAALALIVGGTAAGGPIGTVLAAVGSTLGTTALVSFLYDPFLKEILAQEIFERVGLRDSIVRAGLVDITGPAEAKLAAVLAGSRRVVAAPLDPLVWAKERFGEILDAAKVAQADVVVLLPLPDASPARTLLARRLDMGESELDRKLKELPDELLKAWDRSQVAGGATLRVLWHDGLLSDGLLLCDAVAVLETGPAVRQSATDRIGLVQTFEMSSGYGAWIADQLHELVESGVPAGVRPVTPAGQLPGRRAQGAQAAGPAPREVAVPAPQGRDASRGATSTSRSAHAPQDASTQPPPRATGGVDGGYQERDDES